MVMDFFNFNIVDTSVQPAWQDIYFVKLRAGEISIFVICFCKYGIKKSTILINN